jgi:hypothetical protein
MSTGRGAGQLGWDRCKERRCMRCKGGKKKRASDVIMDESVELRLRLRLA